MFLYSNHFMRDYLGNVRYVSGIYQYNDYDPLGKIIYSSNLNKNVYLYEGKERIPDIAEEYESVYDFGARYYNPLYGRWFAPDPAKQGINPYVYCGNNPVQLVDPDGNEVIIIGDKNLIMMIIKQLQSMVKRQLELSMDEETNELSYRILRPEKKLNKRSKKMAEIIDSKDVLVELELMDSPDVYGNTTTIGGAFMGSEYDEVNKTAKTRQIVDPKFLGIFEKAAGLRKGSAAFHELTEAFIGGKTAIAQGRSIPDSRQDRNSFEQIHNAAYPVAKVDYRYRDAEGNIIKRGESHVYATKIEFILESKDPHVLPEVYLEKKFNYLK